MFSFKCLLDVSCIEAASWVFIYKLASVEDNSILSIPLTKNLSCFFFSFPAPPLFKSHFEYSIWNSLSQTYVWITPWFLKEFHQMSCLWKGLSLCHFINDMSPSLLCILHPTFSFLCHFTTSWCSISLLSVRPHRKEAWTDNKEILHHEVVKWHKKEKVGCLSILTEKRLGSN